MGNAQAIFGAICVIFMFVFTKILFPGYQPEAYLQDLDAREGARGGGGNNNQG